MDTDTDTADRYEAEDTADADTYDIAREVLTGLPRRPGTLR